jgi:hypothetical protein
MVPIFRKFLLNGWRDRLILNLTGFWHRVLLLIDTHCRRLPWEWLALPLGPG